MNIPVEIWLRGENHATTDTIGPVSRGPDAWTDEDVTAVLEEMLRALERAARPGAPRDRPVALRGFSWIVSPFESGGVVIALELTLGAVVAGPFEIPERDLTAAIGRIVDAQRSPSPTVH